ncbi:hypothetical protein F4810DRAFT_710707 [Camillea tinctor]|nr:hypothetical protein F4810DRAFT_710707 [Camillea tinctor]
MVGLIGRFKKQKSPVTLGSPQRDDIIPPQAPATPQNPVLSVSRNFSYPTSVGNSINSATTSPSSGNDQSAWNQLGEICSFSSDTSPQIGQAGSAGIYDPFFFKSYRTSYHPLIDKDGHSGDRPQPDRHDRPRSSSQEEHKTRNKQRRSALFGLSTSEVQNARL